MPESLRVVLDVVLGGFVGSVITIFFARSQERTDMTLTIIKEFRDSYSELAEVLGLLENRECLRVAQNQNRIKAVGNWFDIVSTLWLEKQTNRKLLDRVGILKCASDFWEKTSAVAEGQQWLTNALRAWKNLKMLCRSQVGND